MLQMVKKKLKNQKGFTLIELLAVIVILGILAAIAIPSINKVIQNSRVDAVKADAIAVYNAAKLYASQNEGDAEFTDEDMKNGDNAVLDNTKLDTITIYVQNNGSLLLSAEGDAGSVSVSITKANYAQLNNKDNWKPGENGIVINEDSPESPAS